MKVCIHELQIPEIKIEKLIVNIQPNPPPPQKTAAEVNICPFLEQR
jgi:hypothetical protein